MTEYKTSNLQSWRRVKIGDPRDSMETKRCIERRTWTRTTIDYLVRSSFLQDLGDKSLAHVEDDELASSRRVVLRKGADDYCEAFGVTASFSARTINWRPKEDRP